MFAAIHVTGIYEPSDDYAHSAGYLEEWQAVAWHDRENEWCNGTKYFEFWAWLNNLNSDITVYGWNMWRAWCLLDGVQEISDGRITCDTSGLKPKHTFIAGDPPTVIKIGMPNGKEARLIDLVNYGITQANYTSLPWTGYDFDLEGELTIYDDEIVCAKAKEAACDYQRLCREFAMGEPQATAASQAWHCYQLHHRGPNPADPEASHGATNLEEAAYFGGRAECKRLGKFSERLYHIDTNAMYTSIGLNAMFPRALVHCWTSRPGCNDMPTHLSGDRPWSVQKGQYITTEEQRLWDSSLLIADVTICTDQPWYPASDMVRVTELRQPDRRDPQERVIYPVGTFRTALCGPELDIAVGHNHVQKWHRVQYYEPAPLMASWSEWALAMRAKVKAGPLAHLATCAKKIINSLPGKWGQRVKQFKDFGPLDMYDPEEHREVDWCMEYGRHPKTGEMTQYRTIGGHCQYLDTEQLAIGACPAVAAFWTSHGRRALLLLILAAGWENVYYYHTDGLLVNAAGLERLKAFMGNEAGELRQTAEGNDGKVIGVHGYHLAGSWHVAGVMADTEDETFARQMWRHSVGKPVQHQNEPVDKVTNYNHGTVTADGRVLPFIVGAMTGKVVCSPQAPITQLQENCT